MQGHDRRVEIHSTLPKPWEAEATFHDALYEWMERAPWLGLSGAAHLLVFFLLMAIPWDQLKRPEPTIIQGQVEQPPEEVFEPEPEEPDDPIIPQDVDALDDPVLIDSLDDFTEDVPAEPSEFESDIASEDDSPFDPFDSNTIIGIGGPPGGPGGRGGKMGSRGGPPRHEKTILAGLTWLAAHQSPDGSWDGDGFHERCGSIGNTVCDGAGYATHDVGLTALALLAFLGTENTVNDGPFRDVVSRGMTWLKDQQEENGLIGGRQSHEFLYGHALATLAMAENYALTRSPQYKRPTQEAVYFLQGARSPYGAWRYEAPPVGDADTSVTGWAIFALSTAREAGLVVDEQALVDSLAFIDSVTDRSTGRVGYTAMGELSSRTAANEHFPREKGEAMTAVGLLCRVFLGQTPEEEPVLDKHAELLRRTLPTWDPDGFGCDMYFWYYGTYAAFQMGGATWKAWRGALGDAVVKTQRTDGDAAGSWDPVGPWGYVGGRVYATAIQTLTLEVYHRYAPLLSRR